MPIKAPEPGQCSHLVSRLIVEGVGGVSGPLGGIKKFVLRAPRELVEKPKMPDRNEAPVVDKKQVWQRPVLTHLDAGSAEGFAGPPNQDGGTFITNPS